MTHLNLPHETNSLKVENRKKLKSKNASVGRQPGESMESVVKKKRKATAGRICRKGRF